MSGKYWQVLYGSQTICTAWPWHHIFEKAEIGLGSEQIDKLDSYLIARDRAR